MANPIPHGSSNYGESHPSRGLGWWQISSLMSPRIIANPIPHGSSDTGESHLEPLDDGDSHHSWVLGWWGVPPHINIYPLLSNTPYPTIQQRWSIRSLAHMYPYLFTIPKIPPYLQVSQLHTHLIHPSICLGLHLSPFPFTSHKYTLFAVHSFNMFKPSKFSLFSVTTTPHFIHSSYSTFQSKEIYLVYFCTHILLLQTHVNLSVSSTTLTNSHLYVLKYPSEYQQFAYLSSPSHISKNPFLTAQRQLT